MKGKWDALQEDRRHELFGLADDDNVLMRGSFARVLMDMVINENVVKKTVVRRTGTMTLMDRDSFMAHFRYVRGWKFARRKSLWKQVSQAPSQFRTEENKMGEMLVWVPHLPSISEDEMMEQMKRQVDSMSMADARSAIAPELSHGPAGEGVGNVREPAPLDFLDDCFSPAGEEEDVPQQSVASSGVPQQSAAPGGVTPRLSRKRKLRGKKRSSSSALQD